jgi:hypothetical protein
LHIQSQHHSHYLDGRVFILCSMKKPIHDLCISLFAAATMMMAAPLSAIESASYEVLHSDGAFELRDYAAQIRVETEVEGSFKQAGNRAFSDLFAYISGDNQQQQKIAMTAPVSQDTSEKIAMTSPVTQSSSEAGLWRIGFLVPAQYTAETVPLPTNRAVKLREVPASKMVAVRYTGTWSSDNYDKQLQALRSWMKEQSLKAAGEPTWARYDSPFKPWFLRRNEILIPVTETSSTGTVAVHSGASTRLP